MDQMSKNVCVKVIACSDEPPESYHPTLFLSAWQDFNLKKKKKTAEYD